MQAVKRGLAQDMLREKTDLGRHEFETNCAVCHGVEGHGDGPYAGVLNTLVPDLTMLSQRHGGTFPFQRVYDIIDGTDMVRAHGTRQMPIWGQAYVFKAEENYFTWRAFPWDVFVKGGSGLGFSYRVRLICGKMAAPLKQSNLCDQHFMMARPFR